MKKIFVILLTYASICFSQPTTAVKSGDTFGVMNEVISIIVTVTNTSSGNPVSGVSVSFDTTGVPTGASGQLSASSVDTDANGEALVTFIFGDSLGSYGVQAIANDDTLDFNLSALSNKETRKRLAIEGQRLFDEIITNNALKESGIRGQSKGKNKINFSKLPNQAEKDVLESSIDEAVDEIIARALRIKDLIE